MGENIKVTFYVNENKRTVKEVLAVTKEGVKIDLDNSIEEIRFSSIIQANLLI